MNDLLIFFLVSFSWWIFLSSFAVSAGLHRYFSHSAFNAPKWYEYAVLLLAPLAGSGPVLGWVGVHRMHHTFSDTEKDPHSPTHVGFWRVITSTFKVPAIPKTFIKDMLKNKRVLFFYKYHKQIRFFTALITFISLPNFYFFSLIVAPFFYGHLSFGLLNALCHKNGKVTNSWFVNIFTGGDGWHANHHDDPSNPNIGIMWWQFDLGAFFIKLLSKNY